MTPPVSCPGPPLPGGGARRAAASLGVLLGLALLVDAGAILERLAGMDLRWVAVGLALGTLQVTLSAWRWRFTARRLGLRLPLGLAVREYYLATLLNQVLPGAVVGDLSRAWRHGRGDGAPGPALRAVILERASGQGVMGAVAALSLVVVAGSAVPGASDLPARIAAGLGRLLAGPAEGPDVDARAVLLLGVGATGLAAAGGWRAACTRLRLPSLEALGARLARDAWRGLLAPRALAVHLVTSFVVVGSYVALGLVAARAVGVDTPGATLLPLVAPVLMAMLIPVGVGGWGVREGAAALLWTAVGLPPSDGVAIFVAYGVLALVAALPGVLVLRRGGAPGRPPSPGEGDVSGARPAGPGRRGRRPPAARDGRVAAAPGPASRWAPGSGQGAPIP